MASRIVTDPVVLRELSRQGIDKSLAEFVQDYSPASPYTKLYKIGSDKRIAVISQLPMATASGRVRPAWRELVGRFVSDNNLLNVVVDRDGTLVTIGEHHMLFSPQLFISGKELLSSAPVLLATDPLNNNYHNNTLEWNFGICRRRLRLIEGALLGYWIFRDNPGADVRITYSQKGNFRLHLGQFAIGGDTELIPQAVFVDPRLFGLTDYPVYIHDSSTVYSDADNYIYSYIPTGNYSTAEYVRVGDVSPSASNACRTLVRFDLSGIDSGAVVSAATLSLYEYLHGNNGGPSSFTHYLHRVLLDWVEDESTWNIYSTGNNWNTAGCSGSDSDYDSDVSAQLDLDTTPASDYVDWTGDTLTNDVQNFIDGGYSNYGWRLHSPDQEYADSGVYNYQEFYSKEKGEGYKPKLVVTYTTAEEGNFPIIGGAHIIGIGGGDV